MSGRTLLFVACLNRKVPYFPAARGKGITVFSFNEATGALTKLSDETGGRQSELSGDPREQPLHLCGERCGGPE